MRAVLQRVQSASVTVDGAVVGQIGTGLLALVAVGRSDTPEKLSPFVEKVVSLRVFPDGASHFGRSLIDVGGALLLVPQFTLYGDTRKGRRPDFTAAAPPAEASALFDTLVERFRARGIAVDTGRFGADMQVALVHDGPVTLIVAM